LRPVRVEQAAATAGGLKPNIAAPARLLSP
jgi:hypothetical protein